MLRFRNVLAYSVLVTRRDVIGYTVELTYGFEPMFLLSAGRYE